MSCFGARATFSGMNAHGVQMTFPCAFSWACDIFKFEWNSSVVADRRSSKGKSKRGEGAVVEEDVYNIDEGWKIDFDSTEKARCLLKSPPSAWALFVVTSLSPCLR